MSKSERSKSSKDQKLIKASSLKCMTTIAEFLLQVFKKFKEEESMSKLSTLKLLTLSTNNDKLNHEHDLFIEIYLTFYYFLI